jgi:hypothetical protein
MKRTPLAVAVAISACAFIAAGGSGWAAHHGHAAPPERPVAPSAPVPTGKPALTPVANPASAPGVGRPVTVTYVFRGTLTAKGAASLTISVVGGNRHAKRVLAAGGVAVPGGTVEFTVDPGAATTVVKGSTGGVAAFDALANRDTVLVSHRAAFKVTAKGKPGGATVQAVTLAELKAKPASRVQFLG